MPPVAVTCYKNYFQFIDRYADEYFDVIIVDGRARTECAPQVTPKLRKGGVLILDNSERIRYLAIHKMPTGWEKVFTVRA